MKNALFVVIALLSIDATARDSERDLQRQIEQLQQQMAEQEKARTSHERKQRIQRIREQSMYYDSGRGQWCQKSGTMLNCW